MNFQQLSYFIIDIDCGSFKNCNILKNLGLPKKRLNKIDVMHIYEIISI